MSTPLCVLIPVGPDCDVAFVADTLASVRSYLPVRTPLTLIDNSGRGIAEQAAAGLDDADVLTRPSPAGIRGALFVNLARGMARAIARHDPEILLRMDTDALVIAPGLIEAARARFDEEPGLACVGAYRGAAGGGRRDFSAAAAALDRAMARSNALGAFLQGHETSARAHGYETGEHVLGGGCLYHRRALTALAASGVLDRPDIASCSVGEDVLFGLFLRAAGLTLGEFARPGEPAGCKWRGLPAEPPKLIAQGRGLVHSVRSCGQAWDEARIRSYFRGVRTAERRAAPALSRAPARTRLVVVMPVAPDAARGDVEDTVDSVRTYLGRETPIVFAANRGAPPPASVLTGAARLVERAAPAGTYGSLAVTLGGAFREALALGADIVFRLDVDGLMTGPGLAEAAAARFASDQRIGMLGACRYASNGGLRDVSRPAAQLRREASGDDARGRLLMGLWSAARTHGYDDAEHANGCVSLIHRRALERAAEAGLLGHPAFETSLLGEDILLALVVRSLGFSLEEFAGEGEPLGVKWRGLPADPPTLLIQRRAAVHSVRHFQPDWSDAAIRAYFRRVRRAGP